MKGVKGKRPLVLAAAGVALFAAGLLLGYYAYRLRISGRYAEFEELAENIVSGSSEPAPAWPPERTAPEPTPPPAAVDAGDAGDMDAGPLLPELPPPEDDFKVRDGRWEDLVYLEAVFGDANFEDRLPTIVVLHGRGGRAHVPGGPFRGLAHPVRVIVPQAADPLGSGFEWLPVYVGQGLVDRLSATLFASASHVADMLRSLSETIPMRGRPIVTGFSQGGIMTITLALYHDDVVGEALPMACWMPPPLEPSYMRWDLDYAPIRAMHGDADETIPLSPTTELFGRLEERGFDTRLAVFEGVGHEMSAEMNAVFHEWVGAAVCRTMMDDACAEVADLRAERLLAGEPAEALMDAGVDGSPDAWMDGALDGDLDGAIGVASSEEDPENGNEGTREVELSPALLEGPRILPSLQLEDLAALQIEGLSTEATETESENPESETSTEASPSDENGDLLPIPDFQLATPDSL